MREHLKTTTAVIGGCRVGLIDPNDGSKVGKEWRVESTYEQFAKNIHMPCLGKECLGNHKVCEGGLTRKSAFYTQDMAKRIMHHMTHMETWDSVQGHLREAAGTVHEHVPQKKFSADRCCCHLFKDKGITQLCPGCIFGKHGGCVTKGPSTSYRMDDHEAMVGDDGDEEMAPQEPEEPAAPEGDDLTEEQKREWTRKIRLIHGATGHGSNADLVEALKQKGASHSVLKLAKEFVCDVCQERKRPSPRRVATLEIPKRWKVVMIVRFGVTPRVNNVL